MNVRGERVFKLTLFNEITFDFDLASFRAATGGTVRALGGLGTTTKNLNRTRTRPAEPIGRATSQPYDLALVARV